MSSILCPLQTTCVCVCVARVTLREYRFLLYFRDKAFIFIDTCFMFYTFRYNVFDFMNNWVRHFYIRKLYLPSILY